MIATAKPGVLTPMEMLRLIHDLQTQNAELQRSRTELAETLRIKEVLLEQANALLAESRQTQETSAMHDPVTGLMKHRPVLKVLSKQLARCKRHGEELAVGLCAIDSFKTLSQEWKYKVRNEVLRWLAQTLTGNLREYDSVGRTGGDAFLLIMPLKPETDAGSVCERLCHQVADGKIPTSRGEVCITVSIGIAYTEDSSTKPDTLMRRADEAMYEAKRAGKSQYRFAP